MYHQKSTDLPFTRTGRSTHEFPFSFFDYILASPINAFQGTEVYRAIKIFCGNSKKYVYTYKLIKSLVWLIHWSFDLTINAPSKEFTCGVCSGGKNGADGRDSAFWSPTFPAFQPMGNIKQQHWDKESAKPERSTRVRKKIGPCQDIRVSTTFEWLNYF